MKTVSFCLWGEKPQYLVGALRNAELVKKFYPGWDLVYYIEDGKDDEAYHTSLALWREYNATIIPCPLKTHHLMLARFWASASDVMLSRDCDSRISAREADAVIKWLDSDKDFLVLKDHPWHAGVPILGGLCGVRNNIVPNMNVLIADWLKQDPRNEWQCDQRFLTEVIWPKVKNTAMIFDPFYGGLEYSIPRDGWNFCGATHNEHDQVPQDQINMLQQHWRP